MELCLQIVQEKDFEFPLSLSWITDDTLSALIGLLPVRPIVKSQTIIITGFYVPASVLLGLYDQSSPYCRTVSL